MNKKMLLASIWLISALDVSLGITSHLTKSAHDSTSPYELRLPIGFPEAPIPRDNPLTLEKIVLGKRLFFDPRLSADGKVSCASCHKPDHAFADQAAFSIGFNDQVGTRNSPSILNAAYTASLFWDSRSQTLEDQIRYPLLNPKELNSSKKKVVEVLASDPVYVALFARAFGSAETSYERFTQAISSFERTLISGNSPFDHFYFQKDKSAISESARRGWELFSGRAQCAYCHTFNKEHPFFTDSLAHNTGVGFASLAPDLGRFLVTRQSEDKGKFRTPSLRNVALTPPYMHNGSLKSLAEVLEFYANGGTTSIYQDKLIHPIQLSDQDRSDLIHFLESLSGDRPDLSNIPDYVVKSR